MIGCKCCGKLFVTTDIIVYEEIPRNPDGSGGGFIKHNFGKETLCGTCKNAAFAEEDYEDLFSDRWVKPCETGKYSE